jgi:hypothetical protein
LRSQLAEDYLKPESRRHGVLVITHHRDRRWLDVDDKKPIYFSELIEWLSGIAATIKQNTMGTIDVRCFGINARKSDGDPATTKQARKKAKPPAKARHSTRKLPKRSTKKKAASKRTSA